MRLISEGAEAKVYSIRFMGAEVAAKIRYRKKYRVEELDLDLREGRTKREARCMEKADRSGVPVPRLVACGKFALFFEIVDGEVLKDIGSLPNWVPEEIGRTLALLHDAGVVHGDFTTANLMIKEKRLYVIDFGLSEITESTEGRAIDLLLIKRSIGKRDYSRLEKSYIKTAHGGKEVVLRLNEIEKRGRYQIRTVI